MKNVYCTFFNIDYLAKGLTLYRSMEKCIDSFRLYFLAMDTKTRDILNALQLERVVVLYYEDIIDDATGRILKQRTGPSFFWTFTPIIIEYILKQRGEEWCTYLDSDCFFFKNPGSVFNIIEEGNYSVGMVEHRYRKDKDYQKWNDINGRFNVAFNTFRNETNSLQILERWKEQCVECCTNSHTGETYGDQLFLNEWPEKYNGVYIVENEGIDIGPWNINNYTVEKKHGDYFIRTGSSIFPVVMYHFHALNFISKNVVSLNIWNPIRRKKMRYVFELYKEYISVLRKQQGKIREIVNDIPDTKREDSTGFFCKFNGIINKIKGRREKSIIELMRNILIV